MSPKSPKVYGVTKKFKPLYVTYVFSVSYKDILKKGGNKKEMVKSKAYAEKKMKDRVSTAGPYLKQGMEEGEDPIDVLLKDPEGYAKKLIENVTEAIRRGKYKIGLETAKGRDAYKIAIVRAAAHFEERADEMVAHAMEDYDERAKCIEEAQKGIKGMASKTRTNRIARSAKYQELMGACMDKVKGRKV